MSAKDGYRLDRVSVDALVAEPARCALEELRAAVERGDPEDAATRALARLQLGLELPIEEIVPALSGVVHPRVLVVLVTHATGDVGAALVALVQRRAIPPDAAGNDATLFLLYALWRVGPQDAVRSLILATLRRTVRAGNSPTGERMADWLAHELGDPDAITLVADLLGVVDEGARRRWGQLVGELFGATVADVVAGLPDRDPLPPLGGATVRNAVRVGRNEPCPCGSGLKFKRCHADRPDELGPPARTRAEQLAELAPTLAPDDLAAMDRADLARLELDTLREPALAVIARTWTYWREWTRARAAVDELRRREAPAAEAAIEELVFTAIDHRQYEIVRELASAVTDPWMRAEAEMVAAIATDAPDAWARVRALAERVVVEGSGALTTDLACALLSTVPALGILVARGALDERRREDGLTLVDGIDEARDELLLSPYDPACDAFLLRLDEHGADEDEHDDDDDDDDDDELEEESARLAAEVEAATARLRSLQEEADARKRELRRAEQAAAATAQRTSEASAAETRRLRDKVDELKALITAGNEERAALRRQLADADGDGGTAGARPREELAAPRRRAARDEADNDETMDDLAAPAGGRRPLVPRWSERALEAFAEIDQRVVAMALRQLGTLAAGDAAAWRGVKQAKDMPHQVLMARIGIHHRLLFRGDAGELEVLDLVTRESLMTTLKRLRG